MREMTEAEVAWLSGLIEGEGYFSISKRGNVSLGVNMCDLDIIERLRDVTEAGYIHERKVYSEKHSRSWSWKVSAHSEVCEIARIIRPWMGQRRRARIDEILGARVPGAPGRPRLVTQEMLEETVKQMANGLSLAGVARLIGVNRTTLSRAVATGKVRL